MVLVDGGTDSLMRGDEVGSGTPEEDTASLAAVNALWGVPDKSRHTETYFEQAQIIDAFRRALPAVREWTNLPV